MLSEADNERLTRVGPGTPMGDPVPALLAARRCWPRSCPSRDGAPVRVRLLGEDLVAFPRHRRRGRAGRRVLPAPPRADVLRPQRRVRLALRLPRLEVRPRRHLRRHAVGTARLAVQDEGQDRGLSDLGRRRHRLDLHGPGRAAARPARTTSWCARRPTHRYVSKSFEDCNYLQALEGGIDPTHASIMHNGNIGDRSFLNRYDELVAALDSRAHRLRLHLRRHSHVAPTEHVGARLPLHHAVVPHARHASRRLRRPQAGEHVRRSTATSGCRSTTRRRWVFSFGYSHDPARPLIARARASTAKRASAAATTSSPDYGRARISPTTT